MNEQKIRAENPFPLVFKTKYDFHFEDFRPRVEEHIAEAKEYTERNKRVTPEGGGGISSVVLLRQGQEYKPPHMWKEFGNFTSWLQTFANTVWHAWDFEPGAQKMISESWINSHPPGAWTAEHHHHNVHMAVVGYLHVPEMSGELMVKNPMSMYQHGLPLSSDYSLKHKEWKTISVETNDVVILPAWLDHMTQINDSEEDRYVISLNVKGFY